MKDYLVRGLVNSKNCRVFACQTTNLLEKARQEHDLWPTASAALGRMILLQHPSEGNCINIIVGIRKIKYFLIKIMKK